MSTRSLNAVPTLGLSVFALLALGLLALPLVADNDGANGEADAGSPGSLEWKASSDRYDAHGTFESWRFLEVELPDGDFERGRAVFEVDLASVSERSEKLAAHLRDPDFFDVARFATSKVTIDRAEAIENDRYRATATISLHGLTNEVPVEFEVVSREPTRIQGAATLPRLDFGVGVGFDSIDQNVEILFDATLPGI
ncbi:MAG: YceI family protein [Acidobacteriota bacterium]